MTAVFITTIYILTSSESTSKEFCSELSLLLKKNESAIFQQMQLIRTDTNFSNLRLREMYFSASEMDLGKHSGRKCLEVGQSMYS